MSAGTHPKYRTASSDALNAVARVFTRGGRMAGYLVEVRGESANLAASFQGLTSRKKDPLPC